MARICDTAPETLRKRIWVKHQQHVQCVSGIIKKRQKEKEKGKEKDTGRRVVQRNPGGKVSGAFTTSCTQTRKLCTGQIRPESLWQHLDPAAK